MSGWIKLHRKIKGWEWYSDTNTFRLFVHLLISANHKSNRWMGNNITRGQLATGYYALSKDTGLSLSQLRTSIYKLKLTSEIAVKTYNKFSIITVLKYDDYQGDDKQDDISIAEVSHKNDKQIATNKNDNNAKNEKNIMFEEFWSAYPRKVNKTLATTAFSKSLKTGVNYEIIIRGASDFAEHCRVSATETQFIPHPATWLNQCRWENDYLADAERIRTTPPSYNGKPSQTSMAISTAIKVAKDKTEAMERQKGDVDLLF